ncbi:hypothetical protein KGF54_000524 [Candida jiufengensis]|uniref:uncharacterized protein n=1 Tax=Candida jiufengensis TaxID=497108 RepID=UPI0022244E9C|nr:uncharacterized protein KGF54_000524 [Candida jiufengensis]KAI5956905.1 hypothetical protein KGF54_000524 [Candida jiufengensis]
MSIKIRRGDDYYILGHDLPTILNTVIIPAPKLSINFKIFINNHQLTEEDSDNELFQLTSTKFHSFWSRCRYSSTIDVSAESEYSFSVICQDQIFLDSNSLTKLSSIDISLTCLTYSLNIPLKDLLGTFNYLLTSWFISVELQYPCVFSIIGRKFIELNLYWYKKMKLEFLKDFGIINSEKVIPRYVDIIKEKFTTSSLLKDSSSYSHVYDQDSSKVSDFSSIVRSYSLNLIDLIEIE